MSYLWSQWIPIDNQSIESSSVKNPLGDSEKKASWAIGLKVETMASRRWCWVMCICGTVELGGGEKTHINIHRHHPHIRPSHPSLHLWADPNLVFASFLSWRFWRFVFCSWANYSPTYRTYQACQHFFMDPLIFPDAPTGGSPNPTSRQSIPWIEPQECRAKGPPPRFDKDIGLLAGACQLGFCVSTWRRTLGKTGAFFPYNNPFLLILNPPPNTKHGK